MSNIKLIWADGAYTEKLINWVIEHFQCVLEIVKRSDQKGLRLSKRYWGRHLWSRGYCVSTVGLDEDQICKYVKWQNHKDRQTEQLGLWQ
jgi:REP element-mobilizing transposase RayT